MNSLEQEIEDRFTQFHTLRSKRKLCYAEFGDPSGTPLLYFHGWPSSRLQGKGLDALGKELGVRVIAPDRPGLGRSDHHEGRTLQDWPQYVSELLEGLSITGPIHLMGVSGGGPYALATAVALGERISSTSVVCGAPPLCELPNRRDMLWVYQALLLARPAMPYLIKPAIPLTKWIASRTYDQAPLSWFVKCLSPSDQSIFGEEGTADFALYSFRESLAMDGAGLINDADAYLENWNLDFSKVQHPIHLWHGTADKNIPFSMAQYLASQIPESITHWLEGDGHYTVPIKHAREILQTALLEE